MDLLQLVFAFVNAPLFATFALGMFWRRTTGHGAFCGLIAGTVGAAVHHGLTLPIGSVPGIKGGFIHVVGRYHSDLAQTFWTAIVAFSTCLIVTVAVSLLTQPRPEQELHGLVYSLTVKPASVERVWYRRPTVLAMFLLMATVALNIIFF
jgi:SSS family solute:Na+ symporter